MPVLMYLGMQPCTCTGLHGALGGVVTCPCIKAKSRAASLTVCATTPGTSYSGAMLNKPC